MTSKEQTPTAQELEEFEQFKKFKAQREKQQRRRENREQYNAMVDEEIAAAVPELIGLSEQIRTVKRAVYENFKAIIDMKSDVMALTHDGQRSHTFTNTGNTARLTLGVHCVDAYRDTVEDGIAMVKEYICGLAKDEETQALVDAILQLLSKDQQGNLKASRVMQLRKLAQKSGNERFIEGVNIIEESYQPNTSKTYIRLEVRGKNGGWTTVPLAMTDADDDDRPDKDKRDK
jgi:hypothetical protein